MTNFSNSKGGLLSLMIVFGRPCTAKILSNVGIMVGADMLLKISTSGNRDF